LKSEWLGFGPCLSVFVFVYMVLEGNW